VPNTPRSQFWWSRIGRDAVLAPLLALVVAAIFPQWALYAFGWSGLVLFFLGRAAWKEWSAGNQPAHAMTAAEARRILDRELARLQLVSYSELAQRVDEPKQTSEVVSLSGARYYVDIVTAWDSEPYGPVRVLVSVDSGRWDAFVPLTDSLIKSKDDRP
jgi:hypothetical protein